MNDSCRLRILPTTLLVNLRCKDIEPWQVDSPQQVAVENIIDMAEVWLFDYIRSVSDRQTPAFVL